MQFKDVPEYVLDGHFEVLNRSKSKLAQGL